MKIGGVDETSAQIITRNIACFSDYGTARNIRQVSIWLSLRRIFSRAFIRAEANRAVAFDAAGDAEQVPGDYRFA